MKKTIIAVVVGAILVIPGTALARGDNAPSWTKMLYRISSDESDPTISKFVDGNNTCYVAMPPMYRDTKPSISCVKN